jgi:thymidylate synthase (FAD)
MINKLDFLEDGNSFVALVDRMKQDHALKVTNAARASYDTEKTEFDDKDKKLTKFLWTHEHTSPFRHSYYTFQVKLPIFVARQLMKYQVGSTFKSVEANGDEVFIEELEHFYDVDKGCSWNEVSGRYTKTSDDYYIPKKLRSNPGHGNKQSSGEYKNPTKEYTMGFMYPTEILDKMVDHCRAGLSLYRKLVNNGVAKEIARTILPQSMYTKVYWTISLQSVIWFLHQRLKPDAQYEIRMLAEAIYDLVKPDLDNLGISKEDL